MTAIGHVLRALLALAVGFTLGSVLPAELLARRRGIDIRSVGDGNPGTYNAFRGLGRGPGLVTLAYDTSVGILAIRIATLLGTSEGVAFLAGMAAIAGHRFPLFARFRGGGQGMAASAGLIVYGIAIALPRGWLSAVDVGVLIAIGLVTFASTRSDSMVAIITLPALVIRVLLARTDWQYLAFMATLAAHIWIVQATLNMHWRLLKPLRPIRGRMHD